MQSTIHPQIASFVIRFVWDQPDILTSDVVASQSSDQMQTDFAAPAYRGAIRNIQTDEEMAFTRWQDAMEFINRFVPLVLDS
jgi:hypothetical protein